MNTSINKQKGLRHPPHISGSIAFKHLQRKWQDLFWSTFRKKTFIYCIAISNATELKLFLLDFIKITKKYKLKNINLSMKINSGLMAQQETLKLIHYTIKNCLWKPRYFSLEYVRYITDHGGSEFLYKTLRMLRNLQILSLSFSQYSYLGGDEIRRLFKTINKHVKHLKHFTMELPECTIIKPKRKEKLQLKELKHLNINLQKCKHSSRLIKQLSEMIGRNLSNLISLSFNVSSCSVEKEVIKPFAKNICSMLKNLQKVELNFSKNQNITDNCILYLCLNFVLGVESLKELYLNFAECDIKKDNEAPIEIKKENLDKFKLLSLNFEKCSLPINADSNFLAKIIENCPGSLEHLLLNLESCVSLSDNWIDQFGQGLSTHKNQLKSLEMNLRWYRALTNDNLSHIASSVLRPLDSLQDVRAHFSWSSDITDSGLRQFIAFMENKKHLKHIYLSLEGFPKVTSKGVITIGNGLMSTQDLQTVSLSFRGCRKLTDASLQALGVVIVRNSKSLETLSLDFRGCSNLSDKSLTYIGSGLSLVHRNMKEVSLNFARCVNLTQKGVEKLKRSLSLKQNSIQKLSLNFGDCPQVVTKSEKIEFESSDSLKNKKSLKKSETSSQFSCNIF